VGAGGFEVGIFQIEGEGDPPVGVGGGGAHFHGAASFPTAGDEDGDGVIVGRRFLKVKRPASLRVAAVKGVFGGE